MCRILRVLEGSGRQNQLYLTCLEGSGRLMCGILRAWKGLGG